MGSGIVAFATAAEARAADRAGRALTFDDVVRAGGSAAMTTHLVTIARLELTAAAG